MQFARESRRESTACIGERSVKFSIIRAIANRLVIMVMPLDELIPILQVAIGPVILISGVGLLLLSMTNRFGRVTDRSRTLLENLRQADKETRERSPRPASNLCGEGETDSHLHQPGRPQHPARLHPGDCNFPRRPISSSCRRRGDRTVCYLHGFPDRVANPVPARHQSVPLRAAIGEAIEQCSPRWPLKCPSAAHSGVLNCTGL